MSSPSGSEGAGQKRIFAKGWRAALRPYLSHLDTYVETTLIPAYTKGDRRKPNAAYSRLTSQIQRKRKQGKAEEVKVLEKQRRELPSGDPCDPEYRRLRYLRYADDVRHFTHNEILLTEKEGLEENDLRVISST